MSTSRDGVKFEFDEDEDVGRNHDAQSVDAVSRIGATSIGEVSLSVASGSHLGSGHNQTVRESTTALAGSITGSSAGHKLEVQADVSETASAVTCVSEKSGNNGHDTASTKALAGSILNYKQVNGELLGEDATSERVRFDNMIYVLDGQKDGDCWYTAPLDQVRKKNSDNQANLTILINFQDMCADKASLSSARSFRSSDLDSTSITSMHKRMAQRSKLQHRAMSLDSNSGSNNIPETLETEDTPTVTISVSQEPSLGKLSPASSMGSVKSSGKSPKVAKKGLSKSNILRNIFFSGSSKS